MNHAVATILYEDKMQIGSGGVFPPHDFVLAMVADITGHYVWDLRKIIDKNPRNGISKLLSDARRASLLAGAGIVCMLVDRDRVAEHLDLPKNAANDSISAKIRSMSDAPDKLFVFYLDPNMEGLLRAIEKCSPSMPAPQAKAHNERDIYLNTAAFSAASSVRNCVGTRQPSLAELVKLLATVCQ